MSIINNIWFQVILLGVIAYLSGSLSFALWMTRLVKGVDVRDAGSRHATTTNTIRQAGWVPGAIVLILDITKGFVPVFLARLAGAPDWVVALTGALAVAGHCWPVFAQFRGGMGLASAGGAFLAVSPLGFVIGLGVLVGLTLAIRHSARASVAAGLLFTPVLWLFGLRGQILWLSSLVGLVLALRFTVDWNRQYRELWLDRERRTGSLIDGKH